jgi:chorismate mutase/prephenate dehydratase
MNPGSLEKIREELGRVDREILRMLNERARLVTEVGRVKNELGLEVYDPSQENRVYARLREANEGPMPDAAVVRVFREIISFSRALQTKVTVSCLGPEASYTHQAVLSHFGRGVELLAGQTIAEVFGGVERGDASWGVVPVENSLEGSVRQTLDLLATTPAAIRAEIHLRISHSLLAAHRSKSRIRKIYSHPQAFAQCRRWISTHFPRCVLGVSESTSAAARQALNDPQAGAIAGAFAAEHYGLQILADGIEDQPGNTTRFLVLGKGESDPTGDDKTSILFSTRHKPGALFDALRPLARGRINITSIESRPARNRRWEYLFYLDIEGHRREETIAKGLRDMEAGTSFFKVLGSYPKGEAV